MFHIRELNLDFLTLTSLKWNINALVVESAQAREDRKKRVRYHSHHQNAES